MNERETRNSDVIIAELNTRLIDFINRYERDLLVEAEWKKDTTSRLQVHCEFVRRVSPIYQRMMWLFAIITTAIVGIAVSGIMKHLYWQ